MKLRLGKDWWTYRTSSKLTANDGVCDFGKKEIVVAESRVYEDEIHELEIELHEMTHAIHPDMRETIVRKSARQLAVALVKLGWHRGR